MTHHLRQKRDGSDSFGRPGHGAPQRTKSGRLRTQLTGDPMIRFQDAQNVNKSIENGFRYFHDRNALQAYHNELDSLVNIRNADLQRQKQIEKSKEKDYNGLYRFGSDNIANECSRRSAVASSIFISTSPNYHGSKAMDYMRDTSPLRRRDLSSQVTTAKAQANLSNASEIDEVRDRANAANAQKEKMNLMERLGWTSPPSHRRYTEGKKVYLESLKNAIEEQRQTRQQESIESKRQCTEFVTLMREKRVGKPKRDPFTGLILDHKLPTTDITNMKLVSECHKPWDNSDYQNVLTQQAEARREALKKQKMQDIQDTQRATSDINSLRSISKFGMAYGEDQVMGLQQIPSIIENKELIFYTTPKYLRMGAAGVGPNIRSRGDYYSDENFLQI